MPPRRLGGVDRFLKHPLHVIDTDVRFRAWLMTLLLDLFSDEGTWRAANRLVGVGLVAAVPTAWTGWAEWALVDRGTRRVGVLHASANGLGTLIFIGSDPGRRAHRTVTVSASGWLGWAARSWSPA